MDDHSLNAAFAESIRPVLREELAAALRSHRTEEGDRLLTIDEAAGILGVSKDWLYSHARKLGLRRELGPKMVRYSWRAIQKFIATRAC